MTLLRPLVDDRTFQDIVDEAKRLIPEYCPNWTDHNVSDPGVALIEVFAWMTERLLYRLNQVPDDLYLRFLELVGISLQPGSPARVPVTFWLSGPQPEPVTIPAGTEVGTPRTEFEESIVFTTEEDLLVRQPQLGSCVTSKPDGEYESHWGELQDENLDVHCFHSPAPNDAIYFGFEESLAGNVIRLDLECIRAAGVGVDPDDAPLAWETWVGDGWVEAHIHSDDTGGLNRENGSVILTLAARRHEVLTLAQHRAFFLRCRYAEPSRDQDPYAESPRIRRLGVVGLGGTTMAQHAQQSPAEVLGTSDGRPGQAFQVRRSPHLPPSRGETVIVAAGHDNEEHWELVDDFSASGAQNRHFTWAPSTGLIRFGPQIRHPASDEEDADGSTGEERVIQHGAIPPAGTTISVTAYRYGGGRRGNVGARTISVLKSSIPWIARVENPEPARGGVDPESLENAMVRGPLTLRTGDRAVTVRDFERLALDADPGVARARCLAPLTPGGPVRLRIVPRVELAPSEVSIPALGLSTHLREAVTDYVDERRILTSTVEIRPADYQLVTVLARVRAAPAADNETVAEDALNELYAYMDPIRGGPDGAGWPFGAELSVSELFPVLASVPGVVEVSQVRLFLVDERSRERRAAANSVA